jgi:hypothetical protein
MWASLRLQEFTPRVGELIQRFRAGELTLLESLAFAERALLLRYPSLDALGSGSAGSGMMRPAFRARSIHKGEWPNRRHRHFALGAQRLFGWRVEVHRHYLRL